MLELEIVIMLIGLGTETYLFHLLLHLLLLHLFLMLLLLVEEFRIVDDTTDRRLRIRRNLHKVNSLLMSQIQCLPCRHHLCSVIANHTYFPNANLLVHAVLEFHSVILHSTILMSDFAKRVQSYY